MLHFRILFLHNTLYSKYLFKDKLFSYFKLPVLEFMEYENITQLTFSNHYFISFQVSEQLIARRMTRCQCTQGSLHYFSEMKASGSHIEDVEDVG